MLLHYIDYNSYISQFRFHTNMLHHFALLLKTMLFCILWPCFFNFLHTSIHFLLGASLILAVAQAEIMKMSLISFFLFQMTFNPSEYVFCPLNIHLEYECFCYHCCSHSPPAEPRIPSREQHWGRMGPMPPEPPQKLGCTGIYSFIPVFYLPWKFFFNIQIPIAWFCCSFFENYRKKPIHWSGSSDYLSSS